MKISLSFNNDIMMNSMTIYSGDPLTNLYLLLTVLLEFDTSKGKKFI